MTSSSPCARDAGVEPVLTTFAGDDPVRFVIDANVHRRHLSDSQRTVIATQIVALKAAQKQEHASDPPIGGLSQEQEAGMVTQKQVAELMNVSLRGVERTHRIFNNAEDSDIEALRQGKVTIAGIEKKLRKEGKLRAPTHKKSRRRSRPARLLVVVPTETQHDHDLSFLQSAWDGACESAREAFVRWLNDNSALGKAPAAMVDADGAGLGKAPAAVVSACAAADATTDTNVILDHPAEMVAADGAVSSA
jgi:hypothetical protein